VTLALADFKGALASFWLVFFGSIPAALPFLVIDDAWIALRVSNAILLGLLFLAGFLWAARRYCRRCARGCSSSPPASRWLAWQSRWAADQRESRHARSGCAWMARGIRGVPSPARTAIAVT